MSKQTYLIALGCNQRHPRFGNPRAVLRAATARIEKKLGEVVDVSRIVDSAPVGPSQRHYANAALVLQCRHDPPRLLHKLHRIEARFGRKRCGQPWRARVLDLDIILWSGGIWASAELLIPHPRYRDRAFVLGPAAQIAPGWRDPIRALTLQQLDARLTRRRHLPR